MNSESMAPENESRCLFPTCTSGKDGKPWRSGKQPTRDIAGCLATWHVYEAHPEEWKRIAGDRHPVDPDPRDPEVYAALCALPQMS